MMNLCRPLSRLAGMVVCMLLTTASTNADAASAKTNSTGFVLELGNDIRTIQLTPEYKETALQATLPLFSDFAHKLQLPVPHPLKRGDIADYGLTPFQKMDSEITDIFIVTRQGFNFSFFQGIVRDFNWPNSYSGMQNKNSHNIAVFFGKAKISRKQAIQSARDTLKKLGIPPEDVFAEQEPQVEVPTWGTNTIARYIVKWHDPRGGDDGSTSARVEVNAETGQVEALHLLPENEIGRAHV